MLPPVVPDGAEGAVVPEGAEVGASASFLPHALNAREATNAASNIEYFMSISFQANQNYVFCR
ncbi:hypothetical protein D3870_08260 [Noviherbaspirillum cavernae]|uniref:Uncharacterized protein n=2 Tax=Noviherbaspirillum cavernae TaxID=2320862 RepID=A0A418X0K5_9BURK|nr:hypothetical protein D3870_08260 [Noviherbaspirillum cavernae]